MYTCGMKGACAHGRGAKHLFLVSTPPGGERYVQSVFGFPVDRVVRHVLLLPHSLPASLLSAMMRPGYAKQIL